MPARRFRMIGGTSALSGADAQALRGGGVSVSGRAPRGAAAEAIWKAIVAHRGAAIAGSAPRSKGAAH